MAQYRYVIIPTAQYTSERIQMRTALELLCRTNMIGAAMARDLLRPKENRFVSLREWRELQDEIVDLLVAEGILFRPDGGFNDGSFADLDSVPTISIQIPDGGGVLQSDRGPTQGKSVPDQGATCD
jgi:hypothetical protein